MKLTAPEPSPRGAAAYPGVGQTRSGRWVRLWGILEDMSERDSVIIRPADTRDIESWVAMRCALWPSCSEHEHRHEIATLFGEGPVPMVAIVAECAGGLLGFVEVSIRPYAEGCRTDRVGYLEGWFVVAEARRQGIGRQLVAAAEAWARSRGCSEFASDTEADNDISAAAHRALGFTDMGLVRCFRKDL